MSCGVKNCSSVKRFKPEGISFHIYPKGSLLKKWLKVLSKGTDWEWSKSKFICSKHFKENDFLRGAQRARLKFDAVPSINLGKDTFLSPGNESHTSQQSSSLSSKKPSGDPTSISLFCSNIIINHQRKKFDCSINNVEQYQCKRCLTFRTHFLRSLREHVKNGHSHDTMLAYEFHKCKQCGFETWSKYLILRHNLFKYCPTSNKIKPKANQSIVDTSKTFHCNHCPYMTSWKHSLKSHILSKHFPEHQINWFYCETCPFKCKRNRELFLHVQRRHTSPENILWIKCEKCPYKCKTNSDLHSHVRHRHTSPENISWNQCEKCQSKFKTKSNLRAHIENNHTPPENISWNQCEKCPYKFKRKTTLRRHVIDCHTPPENISWFQCDKCPSKFKSNSHLRSHVRKLHPSTEN